VRYENLPNAHRGEEDHPGSVGTLLPINDARIGDLYNDPEESSSVNHNKIPPHGDEARHVEIFYDLRKIIFPDFCPIDLTVNPPSTHSHKFKALC
jgi:hypothetical protein